MTTVFISLAPDDRQLFRALSDALQDGGIDVVGSSELIGRGDPQGEVLSAIKRCDVLIAVVERGHPNVMFELGCAIGSGKTVLLIRYRKSELPLDVFTLPAITVDPLDRRSMSQVVQWVKDATVRPDRRHAFRGRPRDILADLARDTTLLDEMEPSRFEECVIEFFGELGVNIDRVDTERDPGFDAALHSFAGHPLVILEVKKHNRNSRISISEVQRVLGVATASQAGAAMIVTSGQFTSSARFFADSSPIPIVLLTLEELIDVPLETVARALQRAGGRR